MTPQNRPHGGYGAEPERDTPTTPTRPSPAPRTQRAPAPPSTAGSDDGDGRVDVRGVDGITIMGATVLASSTTATIHVEVPEAVVNEAVASDFDLWAGEGSTPASASTKLSSRTGRPTALDGVLNAGANRSFARGTNITVKVTFKQGGNRELSHTFSLDHLGQPNQSGNLS